MYDPRDIRRIVECSAEETAPWGLINRPKWSKKTGACVYPRPDLSRRAEAVELPCAAIEEEPGGRDVFPLPQVWYPARLEQLTWNYDGVATTLDARWCRQDLPTRCPRPTSRSGTWTTRER